MGANLGPAECDVNCSIFHMTWRIRTLAKELQADRLDSSHELHRRHHTVLWRVGTTSMESEPEASPDP
jgi:hypothetical protein